MREKLFLALCILLLASSCKKEEIIVDNTPIDTSTIEKTILTGTFVSNSHPTSGTSKIIEEKDGKRYLIMENLKSDSGPDLRVYLSTSTGITDAVQILDDVPGGNSKTLLPTNVDISKHKTVLIWCQKFSVLFGSAPLK